MPDGSADDFNFQVGDWTVSHRRMVGRLVGSTTWEEFSGTCSMRAVLGGHGNVEDNLIHIPSGAYRALALRSFNPATRQWAIWWLDARSPHALDVPVIGGFENGVGTFYADDTLDGRPIRIRFHWLGADGNMPRWEQAFSGDGGATWETNWVMQFR
ncbi:MAG: hypothetical protein Q8R02_04700 [Hyphomonadaceae bacterium]|nr:hypothetical protein [Hyphomonadaceae bacterium]